MWPSRLSQLLTILFNLRHATLALTTTTGSSVGGIYRPFLEHAWNRLQESGLLVESDDDSNSGVPPELQSNEAVAKGMPEGSVVRISVDAMEGNTHPIRYARFALLETLVAHNNQDERNTKGIQVLNLVVFGKPPLPVWGVDMVSLPGDKHLLLLDLQPMVAADGKEKDYEVPFSKWHAKHVANQFPWGGDFPEAAKPYFSSNTLWTRLSGPEAIEQIQGPIMEAFQQHLELYIEMVQQQSAAADEPSIKQNHHHHQEEYLDYRLTNDPARPMLQSLYGPEWTERVLEEVMFPKDKVL